MNWILDIGSGHNPVPEANVFLERYLGKSIHRLGFEAQIPDNLIIGDACFLPFKDKSIGVAHAHHIIEHLEDQKAFLKEINRITDEYHITAPDYLWEICQQIYFTPFECHHSYHNPASDEWKTLESLKEARPQFNLHKRIFIRLVRLLPHFVRYYFIYGQMSILVEYLKAVGINDPTMYEFHKKP